jgi:Fe-S cluster assembly protein SufB
VSLCVTWKYHLLYLKEQRFSWRILFGTVTPIIFNRLTLEQEMTHLGKKYTSTNIISKGISAGQSQNSYRGLVNF